MNARLIRLVAILGQALACVAVFAFGVIEKVPFLYTFLGPAALLMVVAFCPRFYYDLAALATMILMLFIGLLFAGAAALFNHDFLLAALVLAIPSACLVALVFSMERLKRHDPDYA